MLSDDIAWTEHPVAATWASGAVSLRCGQVGDGKPVALLVAGVHGDEGPWAALALHRLLRSYQTDELRGTLRVLPVANPLAVEANTRGAPLDPVDLNTVFPGDPSGSHTEQLAASIATHALDDCGVVIDVHGGGSWNINCFVYRFAEGQDVAAAIGAPLILDGPDRPTSLTGHARARSAIATWVEMGGKGDAESQRISTLMAGLRRALGTAGVMTPVEPPEFRALLSDGTTILRSAQAGVYWPTLREAALGSILQEGATIGQLIDLGSGEVLEEFRAPYQRTFLALLRPTTAVIDGPAKIIGLAVDVTSGRYA